MHVQYLRKIFNDNSAKESMRRRNAPSAHEYTITELLCRGASGKKRYGKTKRNADAKARKFGCRAS